MGRIPARWGSCSDEPQGPGDGAARREGGVETMPTHVEQVRTGVVSASRACRSQYDVGASSPQIEVDFDRAPQTLCHGHEKHRIG